MTLAPPLAGGYPVVAVITHAGRFHGGCGWVLLFSDADGTRTIDSGVGTKGEALNNGLAHRAVELATEHRALIRTWRSSFSEAIIAAGGEGLLDVPANIRDDDKAYLDALALAAELTTSGGDDAQESEPLVVAVDGSRSRSGEGGWAWINEQGKWDSGRCIARSPLHAEVRAIRAALDSNHHRGGLVILCDSRDAIAHVTRALAGEPILSTVPNAVANVLSIIAHTHGNRDITLEWVKGHSGHPLNDRADRLAVLTRRTAGLAEPFARGIAQNIADLSLPLAA